MNRQEEQPRRLSRSEIETLCVLHAVGDAGCPAGALATRLGLSPSIAPEIAAGMDGLVRGGWLTLDEHRFALTEAGAKRLRERSGEVGVTRVG